MGLDKNDIQLLQKSLTPAQKKFNIIEVIQKFADNPHMHETFRQICLHYESSSLSFKQIIQYLFGQFNRAGQHQGNSDKTDKLRIKKNNQKQDVKIVLLLKQWDNNNIERIRELIVSDDRYDDLYAITHTSIRHYNMHKQMFNEQLVSLDNDVISRVGICGSLVLFVTADQELYLQVLPNKLQEDTGITTYHTNNINHNHSPRKIKTKQQQPQQIDKYKIHKFGQQPIIFLSALNQQQWVACTAQQVTHIRIPLGGHIHHITPTITDLKIYGRNDQNTVLSVCKLSYPYIALVTTEKSIMIVDMTRMKVTNSMCNDSNFTTLCYSQLTRVLVAGDFGGYLMGLTFNHSFGDIQEQGIGIKKKTRQAPLPPENQLFSTRYLERKSQIAAKQSKNDSIFNKEVRTPFTTIVQNTFRNPIQLLTTKQKTVFSYQSKYHRFIKLWNIDTLQVYQKIELNLEIYDMKVCENGLYLVSREKGYMCYYPFEEQDNANSKKQHTQVLELCISSNMMFINTTNMTDNVVYKLRLSNKPTLSQYCRKQAKNAEKSLKYCFYKNQVTLLNLLRTHAPTLQIYGIFGENKEIIQQVRNCHYHSMVRFPHKQGVILWSDRKVYIRCKQGHRPIIHKSYNKGQHIFESQAQSSTKQKIYTQVITMCQPISKVKCYQNYITIICYLNSDQTKNNEKQQKNSQQEVFSTSNSYLIDENTMCLAYIFANISKQYRIIQSHKHCSLIMKNQTNKTRTYFLYDHKNSRRIWKAEQIEGWAFQTVTMLNISAKEVEIICVYKSKTISANRKNQTKPMFYLIKTKLSLSVEEKSFLNLSETGVQAHSQTQTIEQIKARSIYHSIKTQNIENNSSQHEQAGIKNIHKIFFPNSQILPKKFDDSDLKLVEGQILHYDKDEGILMFGVILSGMTILYEMDSQIEAEIIGILNFDKVQSQQEVNLKQCIVYWNSKYKKDDQQLWQQVKNNAIRRIKNKNATPAMLSRSDSLRSTNKKFNPQNYEEPLLPKISQKRSKSYNKIMPPLDPQRVNQLIHKHNVHENMLKEKQQNEKKANKNKAKESKSNEAERELKSFSLALKPVSQIKFESPNKLPTSEPSTGVKSPFSYQKIKTEQTEQTSKFQIIEKTLQQKKMLKMRQPALLFSQEQNVPKLYETDKTENQSPRKNQQPSLQKLRTQYSVNDTSLLNSPLSPKKARFKTESQQVLAKSKNLQQPSLQRSNTKSRASNFKSQTKLDQTKELFGKKEQKKELTFDQLIRQTNYPTEQTVSNKISIKTQQSSKKHRYKTEPQQQLQKSKLIQQSMMSHMPESYRESTKNQIYEKSLIFNMFNKQRYRMKQSLLNHNLHQHNKSKLKEIQEQIKTQVKEQLVELEKIKKTYRLRNDTIN